MTARRTFDVIVLGSGFGGSLIALLLSRQGMSVALLDRQRHPRFAIGESSTPLADLILQQLARSYDIPDLWSLSRFGTWQHDLPHLNCGCKRGFTYIWHGRGSDYRADAQHACELMVASSSSRESADTHWYRADVDQYLAELAERSGVARFEGISAVRLEHPTVGNWKVHTPSEGGWGTFTAPFVIDGTGPAGVVLNTLGVGQHPNRLLTNSRGIFSHFQDMQPAGDWMVEQGGSRDEHPYPLDDAAVHHLFDDGWWWQLRFENGITSFGFAEKSTASAATPAKQTPEQRWNQLLHTQPPVAQLLRGAKLAPSPGKIIDGGPLQRLAARASGPDWAALPNTVGFIDPLHSTGIAQTLRAVEFLAHVIPQPDRDEQLRNYESQLFAEFRLIDQIVAGCYETLSDFSLFAPWAMTYFAAATSYEQTRLQQSDRVGSGAFLNADRGDLATVIAEQYHHLCRAARSGSNEQRGQMLAGLQTALKPFDHVGLFTPQKPNMYAATACEKPGR